MKESMKAALRLALAVALLALVAPASWGQAQPTSRVRIPIVKDRLVPKVDTVTRYDTVRINNTVTRVDTIRVPVTNYVTVHDTVWVTPDKSCQRWALTPCTLLEGAALVATGFVLCNNIRAWNHCGMRQSSGDISNTNNNYNNNNLRSTNLALLERRPSIGAAFTFNRSTGLSLLRP